MKKLRLLISCIICSLLILSVPPGVFPADVSASDKAPAKLTLMIYMCGSNLESRTGAASRDILEMLTSGYDQEQTNVVIMTGGSRRWAMGQPSDALCIYTPEDTTILMQEAYENASMGEASVLTTLLSYGYENYPAEKYALILWDHGGGPIEGVCLDENFDSDSLSMEELYHALSSSPAAEEPLEWIGFDACLMGSAEVGTLLSPFAHYMIASEETEPGGGWNYAFMKDIEKDESGADTGRRIIDGYFSLPESDFFLTLSCIDLTKLAPLREAVDELFSNIEVSSGNYALFSYAAGKTRSFGRAADDSSSYDLVDLQALTDMLSDQSPSAAEKVKSALSEAVLYSKSSESTGGLSVYHPYRNKTAYASHGKEVYPTLDFSRSYTEYIHAFADYLFGRSEISWEDLRAAKTDEPSVFALPLSNGQMDSLSSVVMNVLRYDASEDVYEKLYSVNQISAQDNVIYCRDPGLYLCAADPEGNILTEAIPYEISSDGTFGIYVNYCTEEKLESPEASSLIPHTATVRSEFGSYSFDTEETASVSLEDLTEESSLTVTQLSPDAGTDTRALTLPSTVSLSSSRLPVQASEPSLYSSSSGQGDAAITPLSGESAAQSLSSSVSTITSEGSRINLRTLTPIGVDSFRPQQTAIDMSMIFDGEEDVPAVPLLHAYLRCRADENSQVEILETWLYDEESESWSMRESLNAAGYHAAVFPVSRKKPTLHENALTGFEDWEEADTSASMAAGKSWKLAFVPASPEQDVCISFEITDIQNRTYSSIPLLCSD